MQQKLARYEKTPQVSHNMCVSVQLYLIDGAIFLDEFLGDYLEEDGVRHRKPIYHRGASGRRKVEKVMGLSN